jgi:NAD(P)-dependent dehydrogenase (short-subunit alcohol dehydrogenase family)
VSTVNTELAGRSALVIGASRGIGAATAEVLGRLGVRLVLAARDVDALDKVAHQVIETGGTASTLRMDLLDLASVRNGIDEAARRLGGLDIAVNNAGYSHPLSAFHEIAEDELERGYGVNLRGVFVAMQGEVRAMLPAGAGSIVNVGSASSLIGSGRLAAYATTKHGLLGLTKSAAIEYAANGIRINLVAPGPTRTGMLVGEEALRRITPMARAAEPIEIARAIAWLASDESSFVTGISLPVDGGLTISATRSGG